MLYGRGYIPAINPADTPVQVPVAYGSNLRLSLRPKPDRKNIWQIIQIGYNALTRRRPVRLSFYQEAPALRHQILETRVSVSLF